MTPNFKLKLWVHLWGDPLKKVCGKTPRSWFLSKKHNFWFSWTNFRTRFEARGHVPRGCSAHQMKGLGPLICLATRKRAISHFSKIGSIRFPDFQIVNLMLIWNMKKLIIADRMRICNVQNFNIAIFKLRLNLSYNSQIEPKIKAHHHKAAYLALIVWL